MNEQAQTSIRDSRADILAAVRRGRPPEEPLPEMRVVAPAAGDLVARFRQALEAAAGAVWRVGQGGIEAAIRSAYPRAGIVASPERAWNVDALSNHDPAVVDVLVCRGDFAVAENGAVWLPESRMGTRAAPYLTQHLVLVVDVREIVPDMHAAYARLDIAAEGFGAFIAGPSKTADIEQSLIIGAHGPRSLTILLVGRR